MKTMNLLLVAAARMTSVRNALIRSLLTEKSAQIAIINIVPIAARMTAHLNAILKQKAELSNALDVAL